MTTTTDKPELASPLKQTMLPLMGANMHTIPLRKLYPVLIIALLVTVILNPDALVVWTQKWPVNSVTEVLFKIAHGWRDLMDKLGLTMVFDELREAFKFFRSL